MLYDCETWSLALREENRLRVFENRILRRIFRPKRDANGECRRLQNEELRSLYRSPNTQGDRRLRWADHIARMEDGWSDFKILNGTPTGKRPLERPSRRWDDNIRMDLKEMSINTRNWLDLTQDMDYWRALVNALLRSPFESLLDPHF